MERRAVWRALRVLSLTFFLLAFPASKGLGQSRNELITEVLTAVATERVYEQEHFSWWMGEPDHWELSSMEIDPTTPCTGQRLTFYRNGYYWGDVAIHDCANLSEAERVYQELGPEYMAQYVTRAVTHTAVDSTFHGMPFRHMVFASKPPDEEKECWDACSSEGERCRARCTPSCAGNEDVRECYFDCVNACSGVTCECLADCLDYEPLISGAWRFQNLVVHTTGPPQTLELGAVLGDQGKIGAIKNLDVYTYEEMLRVGLISSEAGNADPVITDLSVSPSRPSDKDTLVIAVQATDPDGSDDALTFMWQVDGTYQQSVTTNTVRWRNPPAGSHDVVVTVVDAQGGRAERQVRFDVRTQVGSGDRDGDGVPDDEDRCPNESGGAADGCPEFEVKLGCLPESPNADQPLACLAKVIGGRVGETYEFHWYLDGDPAGVTTEPAWAWQQPEQGTHEIGVQVLAEGRSAEAAASLKVAAPQNLGVSLSFFPDPPLENKSVTFVAKVAGASDDRPVAYSWRLDGSDVDGDRETWTWEEAQLGEHSVSVTAEQGDQTASGKVGFLVDEALVIGEDADVATAQFKVDLVCDAQLYSDETLECTARLNRLADRVGVLNIWWIMDGATASMGSTVAERDVWTLNSPPPGEHEVHVVVSDPLTNLQRSASAVLTVQEAAGNAKIPPGVTGTAATATAATLGTWLWAEYRLNRRAAQRAQRRKSPSWVDDKRSLEEIWAAEQSAEMQRRQLDNVYYDPERDCFVEVTDPRRLVDALKALERVQALQRKQQQVHALRARLKLDYDLTRWAAVTDGTIDIWDLYISAVNPKLGGGHPFSPTGFKGGALKEFAKSVLKRLTREGTRYAFTGDLDAVNRALQDRGEEILHDLSGAAGLDPLKVYQEYQDKGTADAAGAALPGGGLKQMIEDYYTAKGQSLMRAGGLLDDDRLYNTGRRYQAFGKAYSAGEDIKNLMVNTADKMEECEGLRKQMNSALQRLLKTEEELDDAKVDLRIALGKLKESSR